MSSMTAETPEAVIEFCQNLIGSEIDCCAAEWKTNVGRSKFFATEIEVTIFHADTDVIR